jgi:hypothetical protein
MVPFLARPPRPASTVQQAPGWPESLLSIVSEGNNETGQEGLPLERNGLRPCNFPRRHIKRDSMQNRQIIRLLDVIEVEADIQLYLEAVD